MDNKLSELSKPVAYKFDQLKAKKPADTKTRAAEADGYVTDDNSGGYYVVECQECGEVYPSQECDGGGQIADSGDYNDALCPHCGCESPDECNDTPLVWNVQQAKINALLAELEAKDKHIAELSRLLAHNIERAESAEKLLEDRLEKWQELSSNQRIKINELQDKLATPVRLSDTTHPRCRQQHASDIRAAGFTVGDE